MNTLGLRFILVVAWVLGNFSPSLHADSAIWNGQASPQWINAGNWTPNSVPGATSGTTNTDIATFNSGSVLLQIDNNRNIGGLIFDGSLSGRTNFLTGSLVLTSGGTVELGTTATSVTSTNLSVWLPTITIENTATITNNSSTSSNIIRVNLIQVGASVSTLTLNGANTGSNLFNGVTQGSNTLSLVKSGSGTWNIGTVAAGYSGTTTIDGGVLNVATLADGGSSSSIGTSSNAASNLIFGGGTLQYNKNGAVATDRLFTIGDANGNTATIDSSGADPSGLIFTNTGAIAFANAAAHTLILTGSNLGNEFFPILSDSGSNPTSLIKDGSNKWILKSVNSSYTGGTTILNGILSISSMAPVTATTQASLGEGLVTLAGTSASAPGVLQYTGGTTSTDQNITVTTGKYGVIQNTGGGVMTLTGTLSKDGSVLTLAGGKFVISGIITGPSANSDLVLGSTTYTGTTIVGLTSANSYNGPTIITANSTLLTGVNGALPTATPSAITLGASTDTSGQVNTLDLLGTTQTVSSLTTAGSRTNQIISSNGSASGSPAIGTTASSSTGSLTVDYSGPSTDTYSGSLGDSNGTRAANNFSLTKTGTGTLALTGANTYTGGTTVSQGTLVLNNSSGSATGTGPLTVATGATVGGTGTINASSLSISGNVVAGNGTDATSTTTITAATGTFANANLTFNLDTTSANSSQLNVGTTALTFSNVTLTLNLLGGGAANTPYALIDGTSNGQYSGLTTFTNTQGQTQISGSNLTLSNSGAGSYLILNNGVIEVVVVPEPRTWIMLSCGMVLLIFWRRRAHRLQV